MASPGMSVNSEPWISKVRDISHALKGEGEPFPWAIEGLIVQRSANCVSGHPHTMKSFNMLAGCIEIAHKQTLWGKFKAPGIKSTLFIEAEDGEILLESRIRGLLRGAGIEDAAQLPNFYYARLGPFDLVDSEKQLTGLIERFKPDFVVLSTLQGLLKKRDWNKQSEMSDVNAVLVRLADLLPGGLLVITHSPLNEDAKRPAGSITQLANYATALHFVKKGSNADTRIAVTVDSKVGSEYSNFELGLETGKSPEGKAEVRKVKYAEKRLAKKPLVEKIFREKGLETDAGEVVSLVNDQLSEQEETVSRRYVNIIRRELQGGRNGTTGVL